MRRRRPLLATAVAVAAAACGAALSLAGAQSAHASPGGVEVEVNGTNPSDAAFTATPASPMLSVSGLVPGSTTSGVAGVWNMTSSPASITLQMVDPISVAPPAGELANELVFSIAESSNGTTDPYVTVWSGSAANLQAGVEAIAALPANGKEWLRLSALLPLGSGNETEGNSYTFGLAVVLTGQDQGGPIIPPTSSAPPSTTTIVSGSNSVGGVSTSRGVPSGGSTATIPPPSSGVGGQSGGHSLASTGIDITLLTLIGLLLILCGALLVMRVRVSRRH
jgi:hypothetical protein